VVLEGLTEVKSKVEICQEYQLRPQVFSRWREGFLERGSEIFATRPSRGDEQERIAELDECPSERQWSWRQQKSLRCLELPLREKREVIGVLTQEYLTSMACDVMGCARSSYYHRPGECSDEKMLKTDIRVLASRWPPMATGE
jgi:hypothetical protein